MNKENLVQFFLNQADNPKVLFAGLLLGIGLMAWRWIVTKRELAATVKAKAIDYSPLRKVHLAKVAHWLKQNVRGHDATVQDLIAHLGSNIQLARPGRCLGTFLLTGPTGTGKSFLAQLVSEALFPETPPLVLRMNQYKSADDVFTLLGPPPGRPGFELGGALTRPVLENPFRVIILDELEKAHPDIFDCLYDILDTGSCREKSSGKVVDFSGCVFFATSNGGVDELRAARNKLGGDKDKARTDSAYRAAIGQGTKFNKAFIARWERVYFLDTLTDLNVAEVVCLNLSKYWAQFSMKVTYASPELIMETVMRNKEFEEYGVRQLMGHIRMKSDPIVQAAKASGKTEVLIDIHPTGEFYLRTNMPSVPKVKAA